MKVLIVILALLSPSALAAQTYKMEIDYLNSLIFSGEITGPEGLEKRRALDVACDSSKRYPVLPYDTLTKSFDFTYILDCPGVPQKVVFRRVKEWCALVYADIDQVLRHEDIEAGKIITKGYARITYKKTYRGLFGGNRSAYHTDRCYHTLIFTCIDGKIKLQINDLRYQFITYGYYSSAWKVYVPTEENDVYLNAMFPIIKNDPVECAGLLDLVRQTAIEYNTHAADLKRYILNWEKDYKF